MMLLRMVLWLISTQWLITLIRWIRWILAISGLLKIALTTYDCARCAAHYRANCCAIIMMIYSGLAYCGPGQRAYQGSISRIA